MRVDLISVNPSHPGLTFSSQFNKLWEGGGIFRRWGALLEEEGHLTLPLSPLALVR